MQTSAVRAVLKPGVFILCLVPAGWLALGLARGTLGPNPPEALTHSTGDWALRFLLASLAVTPVRVLTGWSGVAAFRRMLGLFAFAYAALHLLTYLWFDQVFAWVLILVDIRKRPFIAAGMAAFAMLVPLAATSTAGMVRRLGGRRWRALHRLAYPAAVVAVVHYWWSVKADTTSPERYAAVLAVLLAVRVWTAVRRRANFATQRS